MKTPQKSGRKINTNLGIYGNASAQTSQNVRVNVQTPAAVRAFKSKTPHAGNDRSQMRQDVSRSKAAVTGPKKTKPEQRNWNQYMSFQDKEALKSLTDRSVSPIS